MAFLLVSWVPVPPSAMSLLTARVRFHLKRLSAETGTQIGAVPCASVVRIRARRKAGAGAVAGAKRSLLRFVGSQQAEISVDLARINSDSSSSPFGSVLVSASGGRERGSAARKLMEAVDGAEDNDDDHGGVCRAIGGGAGTTPAAKKAVGAPLRSVSNETVRQTVKIHGCEVEFNTNKAAKRQDAARGGGGGASVVAADHNSVHSSRSAANGAAGTAGGTAPVASATAPRNVQSRGITIRGAPGLVENARDALAALVLGSGESEVVLGAAAAAVVEDDWMKIQVNYEEESVTERAGGWRGSVSRAGCFRRRIMESFCFV